MLGAAQMCGIVPPRRDLSNHPVYRAPAFLVLKLEDGMWKGVFTDFNLIYAHMVEAAVGSLRFGPLFEAAR